MRRKFLLLLFLRGFLRAAAWEGQLGDAALIEVAEAEFGEFRVLGEGGRCEREVEFLCLREAECDAVLCS